MKKDKVGRDISIRNSLFGAVAIGLGLVVTALVLSVLNLLMRDLRLLYYGQLYMGLTEIIIVAEAAIIYGCVVALLRLWAWAESGPNMKIEEKPWYKKWWGIVVISLAVVYVITMHPLFRSELDKWLYTPTLAESTPPAPSDSGGYKVSFLIFSPKVGSAEWKKAIKEQPRLERLSQKLREEGLIPLWAKSRTD